MILCLSVFRGVRPDSQYSHPTNSLCIWFRCCYVLRPNGSLVPDFCSEFFEFLLGCESYWQVLSVEPFLVGRLPKNSASLIVFKGTICRKSWFFESHAQFVKYWRLRVGHRPNLQSWSVSIQWVGNGTTIPTNRKNVLKTSSFFGLNLHCWSFWAMWEMLLSPTELWLISRLKLTSN